MSHHEPRQISVYQIDRSSANSIPQGGVWFPILYNLYVCHLAQQVLLCDLFSYADDSFLVKVIERKEDRMTAAEKMIAYLNFVYFWGRKWDINFEPAKCHSLCVSLKHDVDGHPPIFMASQPIEEVDHFKILGFTFDRKLTWNNMIEHISTHCGQRIGPLYRIKDYFGTNYGRPLHWTFG